MDLHRGRLVYGTQGNVSGIYRKKKMVFIKPSGVSYEELTEKMIVPVDMDGRVKGGRLKPSVDTVHHLHLYRYFPDIGGVCHTHSRFVTVFAVLGLPVPTFSTGHADVFGGEIPVTPYVDNREDAIAKVILATAKKTGCPAFIVGRHGLFTVGATPAKAAFHALMAEYCAETSYYVMMGAAALGRKVVPMADEEMEKWYDRYHSERYGQKQ